MRKSLNLTKISVILKFPLSRKRCSIIDQYFITLSGCQSLSQRSGCRYLIKIYMYDQRTAANSSVIRIHTPSFERIASRGMIILMITWFEERDQALLSISRYWTGGTTCFCYLWWFIISWVFLYTTYCFLCTSPLPAAKIRCVFGQFHTSLI